MKSKFYLLCLAFLFFAGIKMHAQALPGDSLVFGPECSVVYNDSVRVWVMTKNNTGTGNSLTLEFSTGVSAPMTGTASVSDTRLGYNVRSFLFTGLTAGANYTAKLKKNGTTVLRTATVINNANQLSDFEFLAGGCGRIMDMTRCVDQVEGPLHNNGSPDIYKRMANENSNLMIWLGDATYLFGIEHSQNMCSGMVNDWDNLDALFSRYTFNRQFHDTLLRAMPQLAIPDNHDLGGNEFNRTMATLNLSKQNFMNWWQNPQYLSNSQGQGLYSSYRYKDVEFFLLDNRSYRESTTYHLGQQQLLWLENALLNSTAPFKVLISGTPSFNKGWGGRNFSITTQCDSLLKFVKANNISGLMCYSADIHQQQFYGKYNDATYPFFDILSGNLASDVGTGGTNINPNSDDIFNSNLQTYVRTNIYGITGDRRYKVDYVSPDGVLYYSAIIHEDMLKSIDDSTKKINLPFTNNLVDSSKYNRIITATGLTFMNDRAGNANNAAYFNGNAQATIPYAPELDFKDRTFSIACWIKPEQNNSNIYGTIFSNAAAGNGFSIAINEAGHPVFINHATGTSYVATLRIKQNDWNHLVWKYDNVKLQLSLSFNGQLVQKWTNVPTPQASTANLMVGNNFDGKHFKGGIDQLNVYGKLITDNTIQQLSNYQPHRGAALGLNGSQNVVIPSSRLNPVFANDFTLEFWARTTSDPATNSKLIACNGRISNLTRGFVLEFSDANKINITIGNGTSNWSSVANLGNPFQTNEWNHVALVAKNNDSVYLYINGIKVGTIPYTHYYDNTFGLSLANATQYTGVAAPVEMEELRIWNNAQSLDSIKKRMYYSLNGNENNLSFYYNFNNVVNNTVASQGSDTTTITLTGAQLVNSTAPVTIVDSSYKKVVSANWTIRKETNTGLSLVDPITLQSSNLVTAHKVDTTIAVLNITDSTYYLKGGWQMDAINFPIGTLKLNAVQALPSSASITNVASEYYLLKQDGTDLNVINTGYYDGTNIQFFNTFIDTGKYFIGWKANAAAAIFNKGGVLSMLGGHTIQMPYNTVNNTLSGAFTIEFWARLMKQNTENVKLLANNGRVNGNSTGISFELASNGGTINAVLGNNGSGWTTMNSGTPWQVGEWNHIALTATPNGTVKLYVNGLFIDSAAYTTYVANQINMAVGTSVSYGMESVGMMDEFRIWKKAKTTEEIQNQMHLSVPANTDTSLIYNYTFDQPNNGYLRNKGMLNDSIAYTNSAIIPATSPVGNIHQPQQYKVTGTWSAKEVSNSGLSLQVSIPDYETNYILGRDSLSGNDSLVTVTNGVRLRKIWQIDPLKIDAGTFDFNGAEVFGTNWNDVKNDAIEFYLLKKDSLNQMQVQAVGTLNNGNIMFDNLTMKSGLYSLGWKSNSGIVLPLLWGYVNGVYVDDHNNLLQWQTIQEHRVAHFEIERSLDGKNYTFIRTVKAVGDSYQPLEYSFNDQHAEVTYSGNYFYRINEVDIDGRHNYAPIVKITSPKTQASFTVTVSPNPGTSKDMQISVNENQSGDFLISLMNVAGDVIWYANRKLDSQPQKMLPEIAAGSYYLKIMNGNKVAVKKIAVK